MSLSANKDLTASDAGYLAQCLQHGSSSVVLNVPAIAAAMNAKPHNVTCRISSFRKKYGLNITCTSSKTDSGAAGGGGSGGGAGVSSGRVTKTKSKTKMGNGTAATDGEVGAAKKKKKGDRVLGDIKAQALVEGCADGDGDADSDGDASVIPEKLEEDADE